MAEINDQKIIAQDSNISLLNSEGVSEWEKPLIIEGRPNEVFFSQDRLLLTTFSNDYHAWGILGPAILIDKTDGTVITELRGRTGAALKNGRFILGLSGYSRFDTWLYDRDGKLVQEWRSYGHYIVGEDDDIRVLEMESPTKSRLVRLKLDGRIEEGPEVKETQVSKPLVLDDEALLFIDNGIIRIVDTALENQYEEVLMEMSKEDSWRFQSEIKLSDDRLVVDIYERTKEPPVEYTRHSWLVELSYNH